MELRKCTVTHRYHSNECMMCFNANPDVAYSSYSLTTSSSTTTMMTSSMVVDIEKVSSKKKSAIAPVKMDDSKPIRMPNARMVSDYTNDPLGMSETTLPYTLSPQKSMIRASKRAKNTTVSYCDTIDSDIEDKSITADYESESESEDEEVVIDEEDEEETKPSIVTKSSAATRAFAGTKPSAVTNSSTATKPSAATKPSTTTKSSQDKEKRATNKRIKDEVLRLMPRFEAELRVPFGTNHWKNNPFSNEEWW